MGHRIVGDERYGGNEVLSGYNDINFRPVAKKVLEIATRQMLHCRTLGFIHPVSGEQLTFTTELPEDMQEVIAILRQHSGYEP